MSDTKDNMEVKVYTTISDSLIKLFILSGN